MDRDKTHREFKDRLYGQFARIGKALVEPAAARAARAARQGERTVEALADRDGLSDRQRVAAPPGASRRLARREPQGGLFVHYRLADDGVFAAVEGDSARSRSAARRARAACPRVLRRSVRSEPVPMRGAAAASARRRRVVILDARRRGVRAGHIAGRDLGAGRGAEAAAQGAAEGQGIVAYCRGPYCVYGDRGRRAAPQEGRPGPTLGATEFVDWRAAGLPVATGRERGHARDLQAVLLLRDRLRGVRLRLRRPRQVRRRRRARATTSTPTSRSQRRRACASRTSSTRTCTPTIAPAAPRSRERVGAAYCLHESADVALPVRAARTTARRSSSATRASRCSTRRATRPESICLVVTDLRRGADPWFVLTGDTLFVGAVGRPDLPGPRARERRRALRQHSREAAHAARRRSRSTRATSRARCAARA